MQRFLCVFTQHAVLFTHGAVLFTQHAVLFTHPALVFTQHALVFTRNALMFTRNALMLQTKLAFLQGFPGDPGVELPEGGLFYIYVYSFQAAPDERLDEVERLRSEGGKFYTNIQQDFRVVKVIRR